MPTKASKKNQEVELRKIKAEAKEAKAKARAQLNRKREVDQKRAMKAAVASAAGASKPRGVKGVLITSDDRAKMSDELKAELTTGGRGDAVVPPHTHDIHLKKEIITVSVTLHNVPPQKIAIDETTDAKLVVSTPQHTRRYRLEFPFPHGMTVNAEKGEYTYENGVLKCVFQVTKMPADVVRHWTERLESVRKTQRARFEVTTDGDLIVRKRKTKLELDTAKKVAAEKKEQRATAAAAATDDAAKAGKAGKKAPNGATARTAGGKKTGPGDKDDKAAMLRLAAASSKVVAQSLQERLAVARAAHERKLQRLKSVMAKKNVKANQMQDAFSKVLEDKRAALQRQHDRIAPAPKAPRQVPASKQGAKAVRFSA